MTAVAWDRITALAIIVVLGALIALQRIDAEAGLGLIGTIAGLHVGTSLLGTAQQQAQQAQQPPARTSPGE